MLFSNSNQLPNAKVKEVSKRQFPIGFREPIHSDSIGFGFSNPSIELPKVREPITLPDEGHMMTIAPTGAGKGVSCIIPTLLMDDSPMIVIDPKGENAIVASQCRRAMGHDVHIIDPMGITGLPSSRFNPMDLIRPRTVDAVDNAAMLASQIVPKYTKDPFWSNRAIQLILGMMMYVCLSEERAERNPVSVRHLISEAVNSPSAVAEFVGVSSNDEVRAAASMLKQGGSNLIQSILSVAADAMDIFRGELVENSVYASSFDLNDITLGKDVTIFLVLPPHMLQSHGALLRLWITTLFAAISRRRSKPEKQTLFLMDEAAQLGQFEPLRSAITLMRGYGLRTWTFWQDASQLMRLYDDWPTLITNCHAIQVFGQFSMSGAKPIAEMLNLSDTSVLTELSSSEMLYLQSGEDAVCATRLNYLEDAELSSLAHQNKFHDSLAPILAPTQYVSKDFHQDSEFEQLELFELENIASISPKLKAAFNQKFRRNKT